MNIRVLKFGGTSVQTDERRRMAASKVIQAYQQGFMPVVVVSAIGRAGEPYATDTLIKNLKEIDRSVPPNSREQDLMMACGEIISTVVFAHTLKIMGYDAIALTGGQAGIITDRAFGTARILEIHPESIINYIKQGMIPVVCGFQGVTKSTPEGEHGAITTLGRGGSDTTASALGAALNAVAVDIYTDVDGVKTSDPKAVSEAPTLRQISYDDVAEIAHQGAKVLHPRAAEIAMRYGIPLWVRNTMTEDIGTEVVAKPLVERRITGVTHTGKLHFLAFAITEDPHRNKLENEIYKVIAQTGTTLQIIGVNPGYLSFAFPSERYPVVREYLDGLVVPFDDQYGKHCYVIQMGDKPSKIVEIQTNLLRSSNAMGEIIPVLVNITDNVAMVSVIGKVAGDQPGLFYRCLETLNNAGIPVLQTSDSDHSVTCLVPESEALRSVKLLHDRFELHKSK